MKANNIISITINRILKINRQATPPNLSGLTNDSLLDPLLFTGEQIKLVLWRGGINLFCDPKRINTTNLNRADRINAATQDSM